MANAGASIEAILTLDNSGFTTELDKSIQSLTKFANDVKTFNGSVSTLTNLLNDLSKVLSTNKTNLTAINDAVKGMKDFNSFATAINKTANALKVLSDNSMNAEQGINIMTNVFKAWGDTLNNTEIKIKGVVTAIKEVVEPTNNADKSLMNMQMNLTNLNNKADSLKRISEQSRLMSAEFERSKAELLAFANGGVDAFNKIDTGVIRLKNQMATMEAEFERSRAELLKFAESGVTTFNKLGQHLLNASGEFARLKAEMDQVSESYRVLQLNADGESVAIERSSVALRQNSEEMLRNAEAKLRAMGYTGELTGLEQRLGNAETETATKTNQATSSIQKQSSAMNQASGSASRLTSSTNALSKALSSLKMVGTLVASMMVWNFASSLVNATRETVNAKSEMEGYFQMLHFSQSEIDGFNQALDKTVQQFQRVNKYSLGETISSIGVEFNLSTKEMEKAMKVTSMITSEYLRAGRNANEASLAVKDVLQGQFQRLSRETGVKGEQLKDAGWSGDTTDVLGLMEALEKVGESRNWDVFAQKANSLNDIVTILQNRFGEWSADMVNVVQPSIVNAFNSIMSFAEGLSQSLTNMWQWLNEDGIGQTVVKIGALGTAILTLSQTMLMYRANVGLVEASQMGLGKSISSLILGLKGQEIAEIGVRNAIMSKILGVKAETLAQTGVASAIQQKILATRTESVENRIASASEDLKTIATEKNTIAERINTLQQDLNTASTEGLISSKQAETIQEEINTASKELNAIATAEQTTTNSGLIASLYLLGTGEAIVTGETSALAIAMGVLNGVIALSPIGWLIGVVLALAGAFYVLSGGLDDSWDKMKQFNEMMQNSGEEQKRAKQYLDDLKEKVGETSQKYKDAEKSVKNFNHQLQSSAYWMKESQNAFENLDLTMSTNAKPVLRNLGLSDEDIEDFDGKISALKLGRDKYYKGLQVFNKQVGDEDSKFRRNLLTMGETVKAYGGDVEEATEKLSGNYMALAEHSYIANTTDDWWEWMWNSLYAGMDQFWIDWDNFWARTTLDFHNLDIMSLIFGKNSKTKDEFNQIGKMFSEWFGGANEWLTDMGNAISNFDLGKAFDENVTQPIMDSWNSFRDWVNGAEQNTQEWFNSIGQMITDGFNGFAEWIRGGWEYLATAWDEFWSGVGSWLDGAYANTDAFFTSITTHIIEFINNIDFSWIPEWVNTHIGLPLGNAFYNTIMNIPLVSDILQLFGLVTGENSGASQKGTDIGTAFKTGVENIVRNIPILGWIAEKLGLIPQQNPNANQKGHGIGSNINQGTMSGMDNLGSKILQEFSDALSGIGKLGQQAYDTAKGWAEKLWNGVNSILQRQSPGFFHDEFKAEFGTDIPNAITESSSTAYSVAQTYAQNIQDGIASAQGSTIGLDGMVSEYQTDAQTVSMYSQMMGTETTTAFNDMNLAVNSTTSSMSANVTSSYSTMQQKQSSLLQNMKNSNTTAYNEMYQKSNQSLLQMRDSTANVTTQMIGAWDHMKVQLVATANALRSESTNHFNQLSNTIGSFYRKIQNPSNWGSAGSSNLKQGTPNRRVGRRVASTLKPNGYSGGGSRWTGKNTMSIGALKNKICPNGQCDDLFDGYKSSDIVDVNTFLSMVSGEHGFGWGNWKGSHYNYIKNKSDAWDMKSPIINLVGGIPTNSNFKVGDFNNGQPKISFSSFQGMAESIFSAIPYRFYYDSSWKGSWLGALQSGACNCYDGASALIAFANACGFGGYMAHGTWTDADGSSYGHVWAVIDGKKMDTTGWQQRGTWTPSASAGSPNNSSSSSNNEIHIHIDMSNSTNYGTDDIEDKIEEGVKRGLREQFSNPVTVRI